MINSLLQHLTNWDARDPGAFSNVLVELYGQYKKYQSNLLSQYPRLQTVYNSILEVVDEQNVEVHCQYDKKVCLTSFPFSVSLAMKNILCYDIHVPEYTADSFL